FGEIHQPAVEQHGRRSDIGGGGHGEPIVAAKNVDLALFAGSIRVQPEEVLDDFVGHEPRQVARNWIADGRIHVFNLVAVREAAVAVAGNDLHGDGVDV